MDAAEAKSTRGVRLRDVFLHGAEPPPVDIIARQGWYPWLVVGLTCVGAFIGQVDASIVQLALPHLGQVFHAKLDAVSWVSLAYLLAFASTLPVFGRLCQMFGRKLLYLIGYLLFTIASVLCGFAPDLASLIAFRVLQGVGGALLGANSIAILVKAVDPSRRGQALGYFAAAQAIGVSAGPIVGGLLLGALGWQWIFWVVVPFGLAAAIIGWLALPQTTGLSADRRFDWYGALLLTPALTALMIVLNEIPAWGLASPALLGCAVAAVALIALFVRLESACAFALVDVRLFREPAFAFGTIGAVLGYALLYGMFFVMSYALVRGYHDSPRLAGLHLAVLPIAIGVVASFSGGLSDRIGTRAISVTGMLVCAVAVLLESAIVADPAVGSVASLVALALYGAGLGLFIAPNTHATIEAAPAELSGEAGAMLNLMRVLGTSLGVATASSMLSWRIQALSGTDDRGLTFAGRPLLDAIVESLLVLAVFALIAAAVSLVRAKPASPDRAAF